MPTRIRTSHIILLIGVTIIMANLQYVGARYVPKFATPYEWDINATYEPLTIVGYQGSSYTSKQTVPAGTQISNETYWALTASPSGQTQILAEKVSSIQDVVDTNTDDINRLAGITALQPVRPDNMQNIVIVGDSYIEPDYSWSKTLAYTALALPAERVGIIGESGSGFANPGVSGNNFQALANTLASQKGSSWCASVSHVIFGGGANDTLQTRAQIINAMQSCFTQTRTLFPNAKIYAAFICRSTNPDQIALYSSTCQSWRQGAYQATYTWCNGCENAMFSTTYLTSDMVHPTQLGHAAISNAVHSFLLTGTFQYTAVRNNFQLENYNIKVTTLYEQIIDNVYNIKSDDVFYFEAKTGNIPVTNDLITLGTLNTEYITGDSAPSLSMPVQVYIAGNTNIRMGRMYIKNKVLYVQTFEAPSAAFNKMYIAPVDFKQKLYML